MTTPCDDVELPAIGELFAGRYQIEAVLGRGGFGVVYAARDTLLDREVAVKVLARAPDPTVLARFLQEAKAAAQLASEHVAIVHEVGVAPAYLVMERLHGTDLHDELHARGRIPVTEAVGLVLQACLGLAHAHARGIVHRDLKPRNLFLDRRADGTRVVKILDFGIAKIEGAELTQSGTSIGTPRYMAPEQLRSSRGVDARTDVWALGVVLYELTTGSPIFDGTSAAELAVQIALEPHVPLRRRAPELPAELERVIDGCLEKEPDARTGDLAELARALAPLASEPDRGLVARIEHVLGAAGEARGAGSGARSGGAASEARGAGATRDLAPPVGTATTAASPASAAGATRELAPPVGTATTAVSPASTDGATRELAPPVGTATTAASSAARRRVAIVAALVALVVAVVVVRWRSGSPDPGPAPVVVAKPSVAEPSAAEPSAAEIEEIRVWCRERASSLAPRFVVPGNDGPADLQCGRLANLGCVELVKRCATVPISDAEKISCRDFLGKLREAGVCR